MEGRSAIKEAKPPLHLGEGVGRDLSADHFHQQRDLEVPPPRVFASFFKYVLEFVAVFLLRDLRGEIVVQRRLQFFVFAKEIERQQVELRRVEIVARERPEISQRFGRGDAAGRIIALLVKACE